MKARNAKYLAGFWDDTLIEDLLWRRSRVNRWEAAVGTQPCARPRVWRAPVSIEVNGKLMNGLIVCFVDYDLWSASGNQVGDNEIINCLMVGTWQDPGESYREVFCLILRTYRISDEEYFERIGLLVLSSAEGGFRRLCS
jgi:hypothetical protein